VSCKKGFSHRKQLLGIAAAAGDYLHHILHIAEPSSAPWTAGEAGGSFAISCLLDIGQIPIKRHPQERASRTNSAVKDLVKKTPRWGRGEKDLVVCFVGYGGVSGRNRSRNMTLIGPEGGVPYVISMNDLAEQGSA
jgi:hypothetical protein